VIYDFSHAKSRSLVYDEMSLVRRRLLHRRVADALIGPAHSRREPGAVAGQVAHHLRLAGSAPEAATYSMSAGDYARTLYANVAALNHYRTALALGHPDAATLHEAIGDLQTLLGEYAAALASYETAAALADPVALVTIEHKLGMVHHRRGAWELAESHFEAALAALATGTGTAKRALIYADWSLTAHRGGQARRIDATPRTLAEQALRLAEQAEDQSALAKAHNILGLLAREEGELDTARHHLEQSLAQAEVLADTGVCVAALNNLALVARSAGDPSGAIVLATRALDLCATQGDRHREAALHNNLADLYHAVGQADQAMAHLKQAVTIYAEIGVEAGAVQPQIWGLAEW
jgi:tetratricopeptide (TPR) repeat protein